MQRLGSSHVPCAVHIFCCLQQQLRPDTTCIWSGAPNPKPWLKHTPTWDGLKSTSMDKVHRCNLQVQRT